MDNATSRAPICGNLPDVDPDVALPRLGPRAVLSHEEAARQLGIELAADDGTRRLTVPRNRSRLSVPGWVVHRSDLAPGDVEAVPDDCWRTTAGRTVADLARVQPLGAAVAAADSALRQGLVEPLALRARLEASCGRGARRPREVARLMDRRSESVFESLLRVVLLLAGLPTPELQREIRDSRGRFVARVDLCWVEARLIVEADGFAFHSDRLAYRRDRARHNELERLGWRILRFTWEDVVGRPDYVVALVQDCLRQNAA